MNNKFDIGSRIKIATGMSHIGESGYVVATDEDGINSPDYIVELDSGNIAKFSELRIRENETDDIYLEMAMVSGGFAGIRLTLYGNEGNHPHFHFYKGLSINDGIPNKGLGGGCIMMKEAKYFNHKSHQEKMNSREIEELHGFLQSTHPELDIMIWKYMTILWSDNNPNSKIKMNPDDPIPVYNHNMPNYFDKTGKKRIK